MTIPDYPKCKKCPRRDDCPEHKVYPQGQPVRPQVLLCRKPTGRQDILEKVPQECHHYLHGRQLPAMRNLAALLQPYQGLNSIRSPKIKKVPGDGAGRTRKPHCRP